MYRSNACSPCACVCLVRDSIRSSFLGGKGNQKTHPKLGSGFPPSPFPSGILRGKGAQSRRRQQTSMQKAYCPDEHPPRYPEGYTGSDLSAPGPLSNKFLCPNIKTGLNQPRRLSSVHLGNLLGCQSLTNAGALLGGRLHAFTLIFNFQGTGIFRTVVSPRNRGLVPSLLSPAQIMICQVMTTRKRTPLDQRVPLQALPAGMRERLLVPKTETTRSCGFCLHRQEPVDVRLFYCRRGPDLPPKSYISDALPKTRSAMCLCKGDAVFQ